jgi:hypothetical protein
MIQKKVLMLLYLIFSVVLIVGLVPAVSANLEIKKQAVVDVVVPETKQPAVYNLEITNLGGDDNFQIYSLVGISIYPNDTFSLASGQIKNIEVKLYPEEAVLKNPGTFNFVYKIKGERTGITEDVMLIRIVNLKDALDINSYNIELDAGTARVYVRNKVSLAFPEIKARFHSAFFDFNKNFSLLAGEEKEFDVTLDKEQIKNLFAGGYIITNDIETYGANAKIENSFRYAEKEFIKTDEIKKGFLIYAQNIVNKINEGNLPSIAQVIINKNIISRLFTTFNIEPDKVNRKGFAVTYVFQKEIKPGETFTVKATTSWLYLLIILIAVIIIILLVKTYSSTFIILRKRATYIRTKGGEFALKISLDVKARNYAEKISVVDKVPALVKVHERFGAVPPSKIDEKNRRLEWSIDSLQPGEERVFSYIVYSKIAPIGKFELPQATAVYERDGKIHEVESNKVFFLTEPRRGEAAY